MQIGSENVHLVRALLDEVFGRSNFMSEIVFLKTSGKGATGLDSVYDLLLWYAKSKSQQIAKGAHTLAAQYTLVEFSDGTVRPITNEEKAGLSSLPVGAKRFMPDTITSQGATDGGSPVQVKGRLYSLPPNTHWKTSTGVDGTCRERTLVPYWQANTLSATQMTFRVFHSRMSGTTL